MEISKTAIEQDVILTSGDRPTLPKCVNEGLLYRLHSRYVNINDNDDDDAYLVFITSTIIKKHQIFRKIS